MLVSGGTTVLLTTQYLEEADQLADRIAMIDGGRVVAEGTSSELKAQIGSSVLHVRLSDPDQREAAGRVLGSRLAASVHSGDDPRTLFVQLAEPDKAAAALAALAPAGIAVASYALGQPSLDEVFFALTTHKTAAPDATVRAEPASRLEALA
jgi:ABC-2 type transport system ATP-binding protein